jgi:hypothetical protein
MMRNPTKGGPFRTDRGQWGKAGRDDPGAGLNMKGKQETVGIPRENRYTKMEMYQVSNLNTLSSDAQGGFLFDRPN